MSLTPHHRIEIVITASVVVVAALAFMSGVAWQRNQSASASYLGSSSSTSLNISGDDGYLLPSDYEFTDSVPDSTPSATASPTTK